MGPRSLLPTLVATLALAAAGSASPVALAFVAGALLGAVAALSIVWAALTPQARMLIRASFAARRLARDEREGA